MGYDGKIWRPDFQANSALPQWVPMGDDNQASNAGAATSGLVDALKARMAGGQQMHTDAAAPMHAPDAVMAPHELPAAPLGGEHGLPIASALGGAAKAGGPQSL